MILLLMYVYIRQSLTHGMLTTSCTTC